MAQARHLLKAAPTISLTLILFVACLPRLAAEDIPFEVTPAQNVDTNVAPVVDQIIYPPAPYSALDIVTSPAPSATFDLSMSSFVPDCAGAVSSSNIVTTINNRFSVHAKNDFGALTNLSLYSFWRQNTNTGTNFSQVYDPVVVFDPHHRRFIAVCANDQRKTNAGVLLGVSLSEDPRGAWNMRWVKADPASLSWGDQPHLGFNDRFIAVSVNMFQNTNGNGGSVNVSKLFVFDKASMYAGNYSAPSTFATIKTNLYRSVWPTANYDQDSTRLFLLQNQNGNQSGSGYLSFWSLTGTPQNPALDLVQQPRVVERTWATLPALNNGLTNFAPQLGITDGTHKIQLMDARMHSVLQKNGFVYAAQMIFIPAENPTRSIIQYFKIDSSGRIVERGEIDDGSSFYGFPNIAVNDFGDIIIGYAKFNSNIYPSAAYRTKEHYKGRFGTEQVFAVGEDFFIFFDVSSRNRWGDYTTSVVDPSNRRDFWTLGQYSKPHHTTLPLTNSGVYALRWAKVELYHSPNDLFSSAISLSGNAGTNQLQLERITLEAGEPSPFVSNFVSAASVWYNWTAPVSGQVSFNSGHYQVCLAVYTGSSVQGLTEVARSLGPSISSGPPRMASFNAVSGTTYRVALYAGKSSARSTSVVWNQPAAPYFVLHPNSEIATNEVVHGYSLVLRGIALGNPAPTFQWKKNGANASGATSTNYTISSMTSTDEGNYVLVASNSHGTNTSQGVYLKYFAEGSQPLEQPAWTNNTLQIPFNHVAGYWYVVYGTTNYSDWTAVATNQVPFTFSDPAATNIPYRLYRAKFLP